MICNNFPHLKFVAVSLFNLHSLLCGLVNSVVIYRYIHPCIPGRLFDGSSNKLLLWEVIYLPREVPYDRYKSI